MKWERIRVECYSGYKRNESPRILVLEDRKIRIAEVVDRWYEGSPATGRQALDYFKVKGENGRTYLIRYNAQCDAWTLARRME